MTGAMNFFQSIFSLRSFAFAHIGKAERFAEAEGAIDLYQRFFTKITEK